jgi:iron(III) transport system substrate-binding protein
MHWITRCLAAAIVLTLAAPASAQAPGYPPDYSKLVDAAKQEGKLVIYASMEGNAANPLIGDFQALYPGIMVELSDLDPTELNKRFLTEAASGVATADLLWSSAMDLQVRLVADGHAATYRSAETPALTKWAVWQDQAYATTYEPITFVYNKRLLAPADVPQDHTALLKLLSSKPEVVKGKITGYDPERSAFGYLVYSQDAAQFAQARELFRAFGRSGIRLYPQPSAMIERVSSGEHLIAYGIRGSYALGRAKHDRDLGVVLPNDYILITSRVAFIAAKAANPNAARLFLDYLLSNRGQTVMANQSGLYALRDDVEGEASMKRLTEQIGDKARHVPLGPDLIRQDQARRNAFMSQWQAAMQGQ